MDARPVIRRTDKSAEDFWCRVRHSQEYSDKFTIIKDPGFAQRIRNDLPFGKQTQPTHPNKRVIPPLRTSRSVECMIYKKELYEIENLHFDKGVSKTMQQEIDALRQQNKVLRDNLTRVLRINNALAGNMLRSMQKENENLHLI